MDLIFIVSSFSYLFSGFSRPQIRPKSTQTSQDTEVDQWFCPMVTHQKTAAPLEKIRLSLPYWIQATELGFQKAKAQESVVFKVAKSILINSIWQKSVGHFWRIPVLQCFTCEVTCSTPGRFIDFTLVHVYNCSSFRLSQFSSCIFPLD